MEPKLHESDTTGINLVILSDFNGIANVEKLLTSLLPLPLLALLQAETAATWKSRFAVVQSSKYRATGQDVAQEMERN